MKIMRKRRMIHPGDPVYYDEEGRLFKRSGEGRIYLGQFALGNKKSIKEGKKTMLK